MGGTKIEWTDKTWNPIVGCDNRCKFCYARQTALRLSSNKKVWDGMVRNLIKNVGNNKDEFETEWWVESTPEEAFHDEIGREIAKEWAEERLSCAYIHFMPTFFPERLNQPNKWKKPCKIFVVDMGDMFAPSVKDEWIEEILQVIKRNKRHTFQLLTKFPLRLPSWSYPDNAWVGISIDEQPRVKGLEYLLDTDAHIKFISFEPLLESINIDIHGIGWVIIGGQSKHGNKIPEIPAKREHIDPIYQQAKSLGVPVFFKRHYDYDQHDREFPSSSFCEEKEEKKKKRIKFDFIKLSDDLNYAEYSDEFSTGMQEAWDLLERASGSKVVDGYGEPVKTMIVAVNVIRTRGAYCGLKKNDREYLIELVRECEFEEKGGVI